MQEKLPAHQLVYKKLREMILFGEMAPGQAVTIQGLVADLGVGMTPIREAIRRLTAEGALIFKGNRRVAVPQPDLAQWEEIAFVRLAIEPELARLAALKITKAQIEQLEAVDVRLNTAIEQGDVRRYLEYNYRFHSMLYSFSEARVLADIADTLWLRAGPSLRVVLGRNGTVNLPDKHMEAITALWAFDATGVADAIRSDVEQGTKKVHESLCRSEI